MWEAMSGLMPWTFSAGSSDLLPTPCASPSSSSRQHLTAVHSDSAQGTAWAWQSWATALGTSACGAVGLWQRQRVRLKPRLRHGLRRLKVLQDQTCREANAGNTSEALVHPSSPRRGISAVWVASLCLVLVLMHRLSLRSLKLSLPPMRLAVAIHSLAFFALSLIRPGRTSRPGLEHLGMSLLVGAADMLGWASLQQMTTVDGLGVAAALLTGAGLVYSLLLSRLFLRRRFQETSWLGALIVAFGVAASGPSAAISLTTWSRIAPVVKALSLSGLALMGKEALLRGVPSDSGDGSWKRRPMSVASVACLASVSQLLALAWPQVRGLGAWPGLAGIASLLVGPLPESGALGSLALAYIVGSGLLRLTLAWALRAGGAPIVQLVNAMAVPYGAAILALLEPSSVFSSKTLAALLTCVLGFAVFFARTPVVKDEKQLAEEKILEEQERAAQVSLEQGKRKREEAATDKQAKADILSRQLSLKWKLEGELRQKRGEEEPNRRELEREKRAEEERKKREVERQKWIESKERWEKQQEDEQKQKEFLQAQKEEQEQKHQEEAEKRQLQAEAEQRQVEEMKKQREEEQRRKEEEERRSKEALRREEAESQKKLEEDDKKTMTEEEAAKAAKMRLQRLTFKWKMEDDANVANQATKFEDELKKSEADLRLKLQKQQGDEEAKAKELEEQEKARKKEAAEAKAKELEEQEKARKKEAAEAKEPEEEAEDVKDKDKEGDNSKGRLRRLLLSLTGEQSQEQREKEEKYRQEQRELREQQSKEEDQRREEEKRRRQEKREEERRQTEEQTALKQAAVLEKAAEEKRKQEIGKLEELRASSDTAGSLGKMWDASWLKNMSERLGSE